MSKDWSSSVALPNNDPGIVARRNPFGTDISVDAHRVCIAIRGYDLQSEIRKRGGLLHEIKGLASKKRI